jgi:hypothetical protein
MKFGTELRVLGAYATVMYSSSNVPIKASFNCNVVEFLSEFFSLMLLKGFRLNWVVGGSALKTVCRTRSILLIS